MFRRIILSVTFLWSAATQAAPSPSFPLPELRGEEHIWWHGRANFKGQIIAPACTLAMEDAWQEIDMGTTPLRDLQNSQKVPRKNSVCGCVTVSWREWVNGFIQRAVSG